MTYATQQQLIDRYGAALLIALTSRDDDPVPTIDAAAVGRALNGADALIDDYLAGRYAV